MAGWSGLDESGGVTRVVAGVDGSASGAEAVRWAAAEAASRGVPLVLVHALHLPDAAVAPLEPDGLAERQQQAGAALLATAEEGVASAHPDLKIETGISPHVPANALVEYSTPDTLVVTGPSSHGGFMGMLLGSVSRGVAVHAEGPVTVVRGTQYPADGPVLLGVGSDGADAAAGFAFEAARRNGVGVRVVRAWWPLPPLGGVAMPEGVGPALATSGIINARPETTEQDERAVAQEIVAPAAARYPEVAVEYVVGAGDPAQVLCEAAADARLVVIGAHHRGLLSVGPGHVAEGLLSHCPAPVAIVPGGALEDEATEPGVEHLQEERAAAAEAAAAAGTVPGAVPGLATGTGAGAGAAVEAGV